ncbi:MAG: hypothetical protein RL653_4053 [Pseudomonadota bacterium]|jgi:NAD(P)H-hydrate epimerase
MKRLVTAAQMRTMESVAADAGLSPAILMETAGRMLAEAAVRHASSTGRFTVLCGPGSNGGDGLVAARVLAGLGRTVQVEVLDPAAYKGEPARNLAALVAAGIQPSLLPDVLPVQGGDVVIDAVFGTGLSRAPEGMYADAVRRINAARTAGARVVSADLPSGLDADTGRAFEPCVRADVTVAFGFAKAGQGLEPGATVCGALEVADIGLPRQAVHAAEGHVTWLLEEEDARGRLPVRGAEIHKGDAGHLLVVAGSRGRSGAAAMVARAALRSGVGLVTVATRGDALDAVLTHAVEAMGVPLAGEGALQQLDLNALLEAADDKDAVVIGPGLLRGEETVKLLGDLLEELTCPVLLDADALNAVAGAPELLARARGPLLLTPHPGEMARLAGMSVESVQAARIGVARTFSMQRQVTLVLKGARTVVSAEDGTAYVNPTGNPGMATAGMGDALAGIIGALLAQGVNPLGAATTGVYAHGLAADLVVEQRTGRLGLVASDVIDALPEVWRRWKR